MIFLISCKNRLITKYRTDGKVKEQLDVKNLENIANTIGTQDPDDPNIVVFKRGGQVISVDPGYNPGGPYDIKIEDRKTLEQFHVERKNYKILVIARQIIYLDYPDIIYHYVYFNDGSLEQVYAIKTVKDDIYGEFRICTGRNITYDSAGKITKEFNYDSEFLFTLYDLLEFYKKKNLKPGYVSQVFNNKSFTHDATKNTESYPYWTAATIDPDKENSTLSWILDGKTGAVVEITSATVIR